MIRQHTADGAAGDRRAEQRRANAKLAWTLATVALAFGLGFVAKIVLFGA
jgi:hypothetical protein